jgi:hypothetical protein
LLKRPGYLVVCRLGLYSEVRTRLLLARRAAVSGNQMMGGRNIIATAANFLRSVKLPDCLLARMALCSTNQEVNYDPHQLELDPKNGGTRGI